MSNFIVIGSGCDELLRITNAISSEVNKIKFIGAKTLVHLIDYAYLTFNNCTFFAYDDFSEYCVYISDSYSEFLWFNECNFDGGYKHETTSKALNMQRGLYTTFLKCDFTNFITAVHFNVIESLRDLKFQSCYFTNNIDDFLIDTVTNNANFEAIQILDCYFYKYFADNTEHVFNCNVASGTGGAIVAKNIIINKSVSDNVGVLNVIASNGFGVRFEIEITKTNVQAAQMYWDYPWDCHYNIKLPREVIEQCRKIVVTGNGTSKRFEFILTENSPGKYIPLVTLMANGMLYSGNSVSNNFQYWTTNTINGQSKLFIEFENVIENGTIIVMFATISYQY